MKFSTSLIILFVVACTSRSSAIQMFSHETLEKTANLHEVIDIRFTVDSPLDQPEDAKLVVELKGSDDSETMTVHGFYDGGKTYTARFSPPSVGGWNYSLSTDFKDLDGQTGTVKVEAPNEGRKGGISINPDSPREFIYANGEAYYPICFEVDWLFALDADNPDDIPVTRMFVDTLADNGYNQAIMNVFAYDVDWNKDERLKPEHEYGSPTAFPFLGSNDSPDHSRLNIEYFQRLDRVIDYLDKRGIAAHLMVYVWNKQVSWPEADSPEDNRYFDYVIKRYQAFPNMVWDISKEALGYGHDDVDYITRRVDRLRKLDTHNRLVTVHDYQYCRKHPDKLDFISVQLWQAELNSLMVKVRSDFPDQPVLNIEHGGYERSPYVVFPGSYDSPEVCLERAYQCVFAGTYPTHYWQGAAWNAIIPDINSLDPEARPKLEYYRHLNQLVTKYDLGGLIAGEQKCNSGFCLHNGKDLFIYYVPKENIGIGIGWGNYLTGKYMTGTWFNPFDGTFEEPIRKKITKWPSFTKPEGDGFRILIVETEP